MEVDYFAVDEGIAFSAFDEFLEFLLAVDKRLLVGLALDLHCVVCVGFVIQCSVGVG